MFGFWFLALWVCLFSLRVAVSFFLLCLAVCVFIYDKFYNGFCLFIVGLCVEVRAVCAVGLLVFVVKRAPATKTSNTPKRNPPRPSLCTAPASGRG